MLGNSVAYSIAIGTGLVGAVALALGLRRRRQARSCTEARRHKRDIAVPVSRSDALSLAAAAVRGIGAVDVVIDDEGALVAGRTRMTFTRPSLEVTIQVVTLDEHASRLECSVRPQLPTVLTAFGAEERTLAALSSEVSILQI